MPPRMPTEAELRAADRIILVDPNRPGWYKPLYVRLVLRNENTVEIPVDSRNLVEIAEWQGRINGLHLDD